MTIVLFILGQKQLAPKMAAKFGIPLVFYGENEAEFGNPRGCMPYLYFRM